MAQANMQVSDEIAISINKMNKWLLFMFFAMLILRSIAGADRDLWSFWLW